MPQVNVTIAGRSYRMACGEGEESHLEGLAAMFDAKIQELRDAFGEIGDMRLHVMAALTMADEMTEMRRRLGALTAELDRFRREASEASARADSVEARAAEAALRTADRIDRLARALAAGPAPSSHLAEEA